MSSPSPFPYKRIGAILRKIRLSRHDENGRCFTLKETSERVNVTDKVIQLIENGSGTVSIPMIFDYATRLEPTPHEQCQIEKACPLFQRTGYSVDATARDKINSLLRQSILNCDEQPAYILDELWFIRACNIYLLTLHGIGPSQIRSPVALHYIAMKLDPTIQMELIRGKEEWPFYLSKAFQKFHETISNLPDSPRLVKMLAWLKSMDDFDYHWQKAQQLGPDYDVSEKPQSIPVYWEGKRTVWKENGGNFSISEYIPPKLWQRCVWNVSPDLGSGKNSKEIYEGLDLAKAAQRLGYDLAQPVVLLEECISDFELKKIGGWLE